MIELVARFGHGFKRKLGTRLVFASDEFYHQSGRTVPSVSFYEEFPQIENGVGMVSEFLRDVVRTRIPKKVAPDNPDPDYRGIVRQLFSNELLSG